MAVLKVQNPGLDYLLDLDGEIFPMDNGYWTKFDVKAVEPNENIPHGIKYSLTIAQLGTIREFWVMTMRMELRLRKEDLPYRRPHGITSIKEIKLGIMNLKALANSWKTSGMM